MSIFESLRIDDYDARLIARAAAQYVMKHNSRRYKKDLRGFREFWDPRLVEKGIPISAGCLRKYTAFEKVVKIMVETGWTRDPEWDRDFFEGFLDACAYVERHPTLPRAEMLDKKRFKEFLESQGVVFAQKRNKKQIRTKPLYFLEIKPLGNLEKYLCGVISGGLPFRREDGLWLSVRTPVKSAFDRMGIVYEEGKKRNLLISPFYVKLFENDIPPPMAEFWRRQIGTRNHLNATIVAWMHWEVMFGRKRRRTLDAFPYLKSPQGSNRLGLCLEQIREKMKRHRFDHVDSRIADRLKKWMESQKEETDE